MAVDRIPVLLDTDIGTDIDDAVCLAYLLAHPDCDLLGITTVSGEAPKRAMMADAMCRAAGVDVPIHAGVEKPIFIGQKQKEARQAAALTNWEHSEDFPIDKAVSFLRDTIRSRPGEITLLTVGPLTNIGVLFTSDPEIPLLLKQVVMMCGTFMPGDGEKTVEWNAHLDPHAATVVFRSPVERLVAVGYDVTSRCRLPSYECRDRFKGGVLDVVSSFAEVWFKDIDTITFHDPLAASIIFNPGICTYEQGKVDVELANPGKRGQTRWTPNARGPHTVAIDVDIARFFQHYFDVVTPA